MSTETVSDPFSVRFPDGRTDAGPIVDCRELDCSCSAAAIRRAIRAGSPTRVAEPTVSAPPPGPVHAHVSRLAPGMRLDRRGALAAVAAERDIDTPHDAALADARRSLRSSTPAGVDAEELREARRRAADAGAETERLRERVATLRGRVNALRDTDATDERSAAEASLSTTTRRPSEVATERIAARQRLALLESRARAARDDRDARLRLEDRVGNLRRAVRDARVAAMTDEFLTARGTVSGAAARTPAAGDAPEMPPALRDALAVTRIARVRAPVTVAPATADALGGPDALFDLVGAPLVIR